MNKCYKITLSKGDAIQIDVDELDNVIKGIVSGNPVKTRQGIFNPSYYISITFDKERYDNFLEDTKYEPEKRNGGVKQLKDIFADMKLLDKPKLP